MKIETSIIYKDSELSKNSKYANCYNPDLLFSIPRMLNRKQIEIIDKLPFYGFDLWNHYEVSWLNQKGKPMVAMAEIKYACNSFHIIESKSMKLYFNSLNNEKFNDIESVEKIVSNDIASKINAAVSVKIIPLNAINEINSMLRFDGICLDELDITDFNYDINSSFLEVEQSIAEETIYSDLLKANCLVTNQPDWGSIQISYKGNKINHAGLLRYIISFRNHNEFGEHCIERIFMDILKQCHPIKLTVYGRYTRRGGIDINVYRTTEKSMPNIRNARLPRQ